MSAVQFETSSANTRHLHRKDYYTLAAIYDYPGMTSKSLAAEIGMPYRNFRKRTHKHFKLLKRWVYRSRCGDSHTWHPSRDLTTTQVCREWRLTYEDKS